ncbi:hypothetical protein [Stappia sp. ICDLI1TA098]
MSIITRGMPDGHVAIYKGPRDPGIEADPLADLSRVLFHSRLKYDVVQEVVSFRLALSAGPYSADGKIVHNVHAHGLDYTPMIFGTIKNYRGVPYNDQIGQNLPGTPPLTTGEVPFSGTVMLPSTDHVIAGSYAFKLLTLGCNATHVTVTDVSVYGVSTDPNYPGSYYNTFAYDLECEVWITKTPLPV